MSEEFAELRDLGRAIVYFPVKVVMWVASVLFAFLSDFDTFLFVAGFIVLGCIIGYLPGLAFGLIAYGFIRIISSTGLAVAKELNFVGRVMRDNVRSLEVKVKE